MGENSSSEQTGEQIVPKKRKRGVRHDEEYKRNVIKQNRIKGLSYENYGGKRVAEKKIGLACK